jgi:photosystem II stability/assembly factor-like uncharacterized protein
MKRTVRNLTGLAVLCSFFVTWLPTASALPIKDVAAKYDTSLYGALKWRSIGPYRGGRSVAVTGVRGEPFVFYMGATGGGVWKTEDAGITWVPISDGYFKTGSVGAIAVAGSDPNVIYVGTGEACVRGNFSHGDGVYKSTDAGKTWENIGLTDSRQIGRIRIHPQNPDLVYVAALGHVFGPNEQRGVFRSKDGGKTWEKIKYVDNKTGAVDLSMDPTNPRVLYAGFWQVSRTPYSLESGGPGSALFKSTDGGDTWTELTEGLPEGIKGKIGVTVSPVNPDRVWAIIEAKEGGVFRSENAGKSWKRVNQDRSLRQRAWYYSHIYADPQNVETVYVLNVRMQKSNDGGKTFESISTRHGDSHDLWIDPDNSMRLIEGNDGGANITYNGGKSWSAEDNQPTAQFYHVITDNQVPYWVYGAQQDNSTVGIASRTTGSGITTSDWHSVGGCESGYIAPHPTNPNIVYAGCYGGQMTRYDHSTQQRRSIMVWPENPMGWGADSLRYRFQWTFPIVISPHDPNTLYAAANVLFKSTNEGQSWEPISPDLTTDNKGMQGPSGGPITHDNTSVEYYCTIFSVVESPHQKDVIWVGTDDGLVHLTMDGGKNWKNITPKKIPEYSLISIIEVSPHAAGTAYLAVNRYKHDDFRPYIYKTENYGESWKLITNGIREDAFVRVVREDKTKKGYLYAGTETGVFVSFDDGANWQPLQQNLPAVPITDLAVKNDDLVAATQGRSFWILDDLTQLHQLNDEVANADAYLFKSRETHRMRGGGFGRSRVAIGANPPSGVVVHYTLKEEPAKPIEVAFMDMGGNVIETFKSKKKEKEGESGAQRAASRGERKPDAPAKKGMNRFVWNMRYPGAKRVPGAVLWSGNLSGPRVVPGNYQVKLTAGDVEMTQEFVIVRDPRLDVTQQELQEQFDFLMKIRDKVTEAHEAVNQIRDIRKQIKELSKRTKDTDHSDVVAEAEKGLDEKLTAIENRIIQVKSKSRQDPLNYPIKLNNKLAALTGVVAGTDAKPTDQSYDVFNDLSAKLDVQLAKLNEVVEKDVPEFNELIRSSNIPAIFVKKRKAEAVSMQQ